MGIEMKEGRRAVCPTETASPMESESKETPEDHEKNEWLKNVKNRLGTELLNNIDSKKLKQVIWLLEQGADPNSRRKNTDTALHLAARAGHTEILDVLLKHGADPHALNDSGCSTLMYAARSVDCLQKLLDAGVNANLQNQWGNSVLHYAVNYGCLECVQAVLNTGNIVVNAQMSDGQTPMHYAASSGNVEMIQALLAAGASVDTRSTFGQSPIDAAIEEGHTHCLDILRAASKS